ncbi:DUF4184 family protein [Melittangium boletus]|uniref:DUF4184 family protein n=1 Tax=Melittangium boletus DSM 14713 TaxID=1294270 RepID=A0A250IGM6_9BACT|nr:DUF4184 family protein [Melittangium boletus]ATB30312.1 hypothetical protein MEBOL_003772 [Melittangium boletus DSM 14713]
MPVTLPAHAAAILPFWRHFPSGWARTALVVGACTPDLSYIYLLRGRYLAHLFPDCLLFGVPVGLGVLGVLEGLVLPALRRALPEWRGVQWGRFAVASPPPRTVLAWGAVGVALVLGICTHVLWDGFTHRTMWPARGLYGDVTVPLGSRELPLARVFQHLSSGVGSLVVLGMMARRYRHLEPVPGGSRVDFLCLLVPFVAGACMGLAWRLVHYQDMGALEAQVWWAFWPTVTGALLGLTLGCVLVRWWGWRDR